MSNNTEKNQTRSRSVVGKLILTVVGMFGFGFLLVPLYDVFCEVTGLNGKTGGQVEYVAASNQVDTSRVVTVQFMATNNAGMSWGFRPMQNQVEVHPGELTEVRFFAHNPSATAMVAQAVPSIAPSKSADFMHKTECFCFTQQRLEAGETVEMPLIFFIDQALPKDVSKLTLSYTLFDVTQNFINAGSTLSAK